MLYQIENPHGGNIYGMDVKLDFSVNVNPLGTPRSVLDTVKAQADQIHHYPDPYCRELVQAISVFEQVPEDCILCGNGAAELIYAYCEALKPKRAMELAPSFSEYSLALEHVESSIERHFLYPEQDFALGRDFLDHLKRYQPDTLFLCNPNNPTGRTIDPDLLDEILSVCLEQNIHLFIDECFLDFIPDYSGLKTCSAAYPHLMILKAFTKSYGMAGIRLGYCLCADKDLLKKMSKTTQPWNISLLAQAAGVAALQEQTFLQETRELIIRERRWLKSELQKLGFRVCPSEANYLLFHGTPDLHTRLLKYSIAIRNCDNYHGLGKGWYRIAVRLHEENKKLIETLNHLYRRK